MWARIEDGEVAETTKIDPVGRFHSSLEWVKVSGEVKTGWCYDGSKFEPPEGPSATDRRAGAIRWIDTTADRMRASDRSVGQYLDAEYQLVDQALIEYRTSPEGEVPDAIRSYAAAEGLTTEAAAEQIAEAAARAQELLQAVRRIRLAGKAAIRDAGDNADMMETARPFVDQLEALAMPADV